MGEAMAIGRSFREALQKGLRSLERNVAGFEPSDTDAIRLADPHPGRLQEIANAFEKQASQC